MDIIFASNNKGKIKELKEILSDYQINVLSLEDIGFKDEIIEDGNSFYENALIKAKTIYDKYHKNVIADDSGLCVYALDLKPGIYSARYEGLNTAELRRKRILEQMQNIDDRRAYFYCQIIYIDESGIHSFTGQVDGEIGYQEIGTNGFGYDPIFNVNGISFASLSDEEKNEISHRGRALAKFKEYINDFSNK